MEYNEFADEKEVVQRRKFKSRQSFQTTNLDILIDDEEQRKYFLGARKIWAIKCSIKFCISFLFNFGPAFLVYMFLSLRFMYDCLQKYPDQKKKITIAFALDYFSCLSIQLTFLLFIGGLIHVEVVIHEIYFNWNINCMMFIGLYILFVTYQDIHSQAKADYIDSRKHDEEDFLWNFGYLFTRTNFTNLGLGKYLTRFERHQIQHSYDSIALKQTEEFISQVMDIIRSENIDPTFLYFSLNSDPLITQPSKHPINDDVVTSPNIGEGNNSGFSTIDYLRSLGFRGDRHVVHDFLLPHYLYTRKFSKINHLYKRIVIFIVIVLKVIVPTVFFGHPLHLEVLKYSCLFTGFYLHFLAIVYELTINDDLKTKSYIMMALEKLISLMELQKHGEHPDMLDITCPISLQGWNTMRRLTFRIESAKSDHYNFVFRFLFFYGKVCFVAFLLCRAPITYFEKYCVYCTEPILMYNIHIDLVLVGTICLMRIYQTDCLHSNFQNLKDMIHRLNSVYEDLSTLFEYYFQSVELVDNKVYMQVIRQIRNYSHFRKRQERWIQDSDSDDREYVDEFNFNGPRLDDLLTTLDKLQLAVDSHKIRKNEYFMGLVHVSFTRAMRIYMLVLLSFIPSLYSSMQNYISQMS